MDQEDFQEVFLARDPTLEQCWQALSLNNQSWFARLTSARGQEVVRARGMLWTSGHLAVTEIDPLQIGSQLDQVLAWYRTQVPLEGAICWYLSATPPGDLPARLLARGFEPNWQPHWMWCALDALPEAPVRASIFEIQIIEQEPAERVAGLPYYTAREKRMRAVLHRKYARQVRHLAAIQGDRVVGRCMLNITTGAEGIAGLFAMAVVPAARQQGIGSALTWEACNLARQLGCHHVMLNATPMGESVYRRVGFSSLGFGPSWHLRAETLAAPALSEEQVHFLEALGQGDTMALEKRGKDLANTFFCDPLPNGLTPLELAVHCQQPASVEWLTQRGVALDLLSAWDIGWSARAAQLLLENPALVNRQSGERLLTPLHVAVERGDVELAKVLLTVPNDLDLKDSDFQSTALGWSEYLQRTEIIPLIEQHRANQSKPAHEEKRSS